MKESVLSNPSLQLLFKVICKLLQTCLNNEIKTNMFLLDQYRVSSFSILFLFFFIGIVPWTLHNPKSNSQSPLPVSVTTVRAVGGDQAFVFYSFDKISHLFIVEHGSPFTLHLVIFTWGIKMYTS